MPQTLTAIYLHVIYSTKSRETLITTDLAPRVHGYLGGITREVGAVPLATGGANDHVHQLISITPSIALAELMRVVKTNSSRWVHELGAAHARFAWQSGYAAFSVSKSNLDSVRKYIANQDEHHRTVSFQDELIAFLKRHAVAYDPRYVFD